MVRAGVLRLVLSVLVAITVVAGMASPCAADGSGPASVVTVGMAPMMSGMEACHHMPAKAPGHAAKSLGCPHCIALGGGVLVPAPVGFKVEQAAAATPAVRVAALPAGLLTAPDTGPPRGLRT